MIEERIGDIFEQDDINVIVGACNCFNTMGAGFAKQIKERYPEAAKADAETKAASSLKLGNFSSAKGKDGKIIINLYSQYRYGTDQRHTDYEALITGLEKLNKMISESKRPEKHVVAIPYKMGCDRGGSRWAIVEAAIKDIFGDSKFKVVICKLPEKS